MSNLDQNVRQAILSHYLNQNGGGGSQVFRGAQFQYGTGIGDIFRSLGRFLLPIFASSASGFIGSAAKGLSEGKNLKDAAREALKPTLGAAMETAGSQIMNRIKGAGRRRRRRRRAAKASASPVYKGHGKRRRSRRSKKVSSLHFLGAGKRRNKRRANRKTRGHKRVRFLPSNF